jgi:cell wall-associated NlpC family hydrolase
MPDFTAKTKKKQILLYSCGIMLFVCLFSLSCARQTIRITQDTSTIQSSEAVREDLDSQEVERRIREEYKQWKGTKHVLGEDGPDEIDCSAFVRAVYQNAFNIDLPRTTRGQLRVGRSVARNQLRAGDLVFFRPPTSPRHVGIFLGGKTFIHASKTKGVTISQMDPVYWGKYYWTGRRVLSKE